MANMIELAEFNAFNSFLGGSILGVSALLLYLLRGDVAGINGMVTGLINPIQGEWSWRLLFVVGLIAGGFIYQWVGGGLTLEPAASGGLVIVAGLLVGIGATIGSGCTSGHGICGIARWSIRSVAATITFMISAMATVFVLHHLIGGGL